MGNTYNAESGQDHFEFCVAEYGLVGDNEAASLKMYSLAYDRGHAYGYSEVEIYYSDFVDELEGFNITPK